LPSCARASAARGGSSGLEEAVQLVAIAALGGDLLAHPRRFLLQLLQIAFELLDAEQVEIQRTRARPARLEIIAVHEGLLSQLTHEQLGSLRGFTQGVDHFARNWPQPFEGGLLPPWTSRQNHASSARAPEAGWKDGSRPEEAGNSRLEEEAMSKLPETMQAIEIIEPGGPEVLQACERPLPDVGPGEVLIRVAAAGVNRPDVLQRQGNYAPPPGASDIPGLEVAGEVVALGEGV